MAETQSAGSPSGWGAVRMERSTTFPLFLAPVALVAATLCTASTSTGAFENRWVHGHTSFWPFCGFLRSLCIPFRFQIAPLHQIIRKKAGVTSLNP